MQKSLICSNEYDEEEGERLILELMAKFSLFGDEEDDDEGPSCPPLKRPRFDHPSPTSSDDDDDDDEAPQRQDEEDDDDDDYDGDQIDDVDDGLDIQQAEGEEHSVEDQNSDLNVVSISANASQENHPRPLASDRDRSISVFLTDPDVLDCSICFDPLTIPVFQVCSP